MSARPHPPAATGFPADFVASVLDDALAHDCRVYGITGLQGSGKSTLATQVAAVAAARGIHAAVLSIDDCYLPRSARLRLSHDVHPLLQTRGPPGTHDLALASNVLDALREGASCSLPRFDKLADTHLLPSQWPVAHDTDLVLFEGWFLEAPPQDDAALLQPINALEHDEDAAGIWRRHCNDALARDYPALWQRIDRLLCLQGPGFDVVPEWRWQQELGLQAANPTRETMTRAQVDRFVQHFERVSRQAWRMLPEIADWTVLLDANRRPNQSPFEKGD